MDTNTKSIDKYLVEGHYCMKLHLIFVAILSFERISMNIYSVGAVHLWTLNYVGVVNKRVASVCVAHKFIRWNAWNQYEIFDEWAVNTNMLRIFIEIAHTNLIAVHGRRPRNSEKKRIEMIVKWLWCLKGCHADGIHIQTVPQFKCVQFRWCYFLLFLMLAK